MQIILRPSQGLLGGEVPDRLKGEWCVLATRLPAAQGEGLARLRLFNASGSTLGTEVVFRRQKSSSALAARLVCFPPSATGIELSLWGRRRAAGEVCLRVVHLSRRVAAALLVARHPLRFAKAMRSSSDGAAGRVRKALQMLALQPAPSMEYGLWREIFEPNAGVSADDTPPDILACVFGGGVAAEATKASLLIQSWPALAVVAASADRPEALRAKLAASPATYVALLQAGEVVVSSAFSLVRRFLAERGWPDLVYADEDRLDQRGNRIAPLFKPEPNLALMHSGTLAQGLWVVRRELLLRCSDAALRWAETARLEAWFRCHEGGRAGLTHRLPFVLVSRRPDAEAVPPEAAADIVRAHLARSHLAAEVTAGVPIRVRRRIAGDRRPKVSIVIPSACKADKTIDCIGSMLAMTSYPDFEVIVVTMQAEPPDPAQLAAIERIRERGEFRHEWLKAAPFNYSRANNHAVSFATGDYLCLLNDDVKPLDGDWLTTMVAFFDDAEVGIVGAKLYYPDMTVQHGGVIAGLAGLAEHVNRFLPRGAPGYAGRGILNQELSAVTGACLLTRRSVWEALGGLDEVYPIGFNDVDYCFRAREAGHRVVFAADAELIHFENFTFGQHYGEARRDQEMADVARMQHRWADLLAADPFHNPNLSLQVGNEWGLACPPRQANGNKS